MKRYIAAIFLTLFLFVLGVFAVQILNKDGEPKAVAAAQSDLDLFKEFDSNMKVSNLYDKWKRSNPGESSKYEAFSSAIRSGQNPVPPSLSTAFGKALVAAGKMALVEITPPPPSTTTQEASSYYISPSGNDSSTCTQSLPCKTFSRVLSVAPAGSSVSVEPGDYNGETLSGTKQVTFIGNSARVVGSRMTLSNLHNVTLKNISFATNDPYRDIMFEACNSDLTLDSVTAKKFTMLEGNSNIVIKNSSFGGYGTPGDTVDNVIGTAGATGPIRNCNGLLAKPASNILLDNIRFHDVFWDVPQSQWNGAHPDCFEINGYVDGVTIQNSEFDHCVDSFMGLYTDQGDLLNVTFKNNKLHDGGTYSYYAIQNVCSGNNSGTGNIAGSDGKYRGGNIKFLNSTWNTNASSLESYPSLRAECSPEPGYAPVEVTGNTFDQGPPSSECAVSTGTVFKTNWHDNIFTFGSACGS